MEKSLEQLKQIERISRQTRQHRTHLNQVCDQNLRAKLISLANEREQIIQRSNSRREIEEERKQLLGITIKQIAQERQPLRAKPILQTEQETVEVLVHTDDETRPPSAIRLASAANSCRLFSHNCQLYPCQPVYRYTSFTKKENDKIVHQRHTTTNSSKNLPTKPQLQEIFTNIQEKKYMQNHRQAVTALQNQQHIVNRHLSMQKTMTRLDEQSRLLHKRLAEKNTFGYVKERQHKLSQAIQRHLEITAKFCA